MTHTLISIDVEKLQDAFRQHCEREDIPDVRDAWAWFWRDVQDGMAIKVTERTRERLG